MAKKKQEQQEQSQDEHVMAVLDKRTNKTAVISKMNEQDGSIEVVPPDKKMTAILPPSKTKTDTAVNIREEDGEKYSSVLTPRNEARDVTLHFALFGKTQAGWLKKYFEFINFLKKGRDGWLEISFPQLALTLRVKYTDCSKFQPLTYLWKEGVHAGKFKVKFREPVPII